MGVPLLLLPEQATAATRRRRLLLFLLRLIDDHFGLPKLVLLILPQFKGPVVLTATATPGGGRDAPIVAGVVLATR